MMIIDPPLLDRYSPRSQIVDWLEKLRSFEQDDVGVRDLEIKRAERWLRQHDELVAKGEIQE